MKKQILAGLGMAMVLMTAGYAKEFSDVPKDYWANDIIKKMSDKGIINGYEDGTFKPENMLNRAEFATIMTKVLNLDNRVYLQSSYADVKTEDWEHNFAEAVKDYFITYERDGKLYFDSYEPAIREDVIVALVKAKNWDIDKLENKAEDIFSDTDKIGKGLDKYIVSAYENGLIKGYEDKTINPKGSLTRAEAMALVNVLLTYEDDTTENIEEKVEEYLFKINGVNYNKEKFEAYYNIQKGILKQYFAEEEGIDEYIKEMTYTAFVEMKFIVQKAKEKGITLAAEDILEIEEELSIENIDELLKEYNLTKEGYKEVLEDSYLEERTRATIEEEEMNKIDWDKYFEGNEDGLYNYNIRHILFSTVDEETGFSISEEDIKKVEEKANEVLTKLKEGEDFAKLAEEYTEDPGSKGTGGLYENVKVGEMVEEFNDTMIALEEGELYDGLVKTSYGYHIMKLDSKTKISEEEFNEIRHQVVESKVQEEISSWFENIKVEVNQEMLETIK